MFFKDKSTKDHFGLIGHQMEKIGMKIVFKLLTINFLKKEYDSWYAKTRIVKKK